MPPDEMLKQAFARIERLEAIETRRSVKGQRRASILRTAGKLCPVLAVLGLATWALGQGVEIKTDNGSGTDLQRFKVETGAATINSYFLNSKLGIGTTSPAYNLHVTGDGSTGAIIDRASADDLSPFLFGYKARGAQAGKAVVAVGDGLIRVEGFGWDGDSYKQAGQILIEAEGTIADGRVPGRIRFSTGTDVGPSVLTERMRLDSAGNLGIGTVNPSQKLEVVGSIVASAGQVRIGNLAASPTTAGYGSVWYNTTNNKIYYDKAGTWTELLGTGSSSGDFIQNQSATNQTANFRISGNGYLAGNVGIGTTAPVSKLSIAGGSANWTEATPGLGTGSIHLDPESATDHFGNAITWGASDSGNGETAQAGIYVRSDGTYGTKMYLATTDAYVTGSKTRMMIDSNGNVGIGTQTSPGQLLELWRDDADVAVRFHDSGDYWYSAGIDRSDSGKFKINFGAALGDANQFAMTTGGDVGIGTAGPAYKLDVAGEITSRNANAFRMRQANYGVFLRNDNADTYILLTNSGDPDGGWNTLRPFRINNASGDVYMGGGQANLWIHDNASAAVRIDNANNEFLVLQGNATSGGIRHIATGPSGQRYSNLYVRGGCEIKGYNSGAQGSLLVFAGTNGTSLAAGWPVGWGGGLQTYDILCQSIGYYGGLSSLSDRRMKRDITPIDSGLVLIDRLRPVRYSWKEPSPGTEGIHFGFIAQEVEEVIPELITGKGDETRLLSQMEIIPLLVRGVQELDDALGKEREARQALQATVDAQARIIESLAARLEALEKKSEVRNSKSEVGKSGGGGE